MSFDSIDSLVAAVAVGAGFLLAGGTSAILNPGVRAGRAIAIIAIVAGCGGVALGTASPFRAGGAALALAGMLLPALGPDGRHLSKFLPRIRLLACHDLVGSAMLVVSGALLLAVGVLAFATEDEARLGANSEDVLLAHMLPGERRLQPNAAFTDRGTELAIYAPVEPLAVKELTARERRTLDRMGYGLPGIRCSAADDHANCFGWVFSGGQHWLAGEAIDPILRDNSYRVVEQPCLGDVVIYRSTFNDAPQHAALVCYVTEGMPVLVESKWGWLGAFIHPVEASPYGTSFAYYRTMRPAHLLVLPHSDGTVLTGAE